MNKIEFIKMILINLSVYYLIKLKYYYLGLLKNNCKLVKNKNIIIINTTICLS